MKLITKLILLILYFNIQSMSFAENIDTNTLNQKIKYLESRISHLTYVLKETRKGIGANPIDFNLSKLKDQKYTGTYGHGYTWYYASESLGEIGEEAIPELIEILDTENDFERTQALYALRLASQDPKVTSFTNGEFVEGVGLAFPGPDKHPEIVKEWKAWFKKYENHFLRNQLLAR